MLNFIQADAGRLPLATDSVGLVLGSPPYLFCRTYGIGAKRELVQWVDWMLKVTAEAVRVSRGLVLWVCAGATRKFCYQPGPEGLLYRWVAEGGRAWRPAIWHRVGIPGSGGKQWLRADTEYVLAFTKCENYIPWADNLANGHAPKWAPGGEMSYRNSEGTRRNQWGAKTSGNAERNAEGNAVKRKRPSSQDLSGRDKWGGAVDGSSGEGRDSNGQRKTRDGEKKAGRRITSGHNIAGETSNDDDYEPPAIANPGNSISGIEYDGEQPDLGHEASCFIDGIPVGGGLMGHHLASENEAPYPQRLAEWFIVSFCNPGNIVLDPFSGSGTTCAAALKLGRQGIGMDLRLSQCELGRRRCGEVQPELFV